MNKKIVTIGYEIPGRGDSLVDYFVKDSLMDADIVLFNPCFPRGSVEDYCQGKPSYYESGSFEYKEQVKHWKKELSNFLESGKSIFLLLAEKDTFYLRTGTKEYKTKATINHVDLHDNYEFLPVRIGEIVTAKGRRIECVDVPLTKNFYKTFQSYLNYQVYLENIDGATTIFTGKDKIKVLGAIYKKGNGHLVALPYIECDETKFIEHKKTKKGGEKDYWNAEAIKFGKMLVSSLVEMDKSLTAGVERTPAPIWINEAKYGSKREIEHRKAIETNNEKIAEIEKENEKINQEIEKEKALKDLLFEQGKPLENAVISALNILGFKAENYNDGVLELDQIIFSPEGIRYIGECEGKDNKDIDIDKFRQLLESLNADFARDEIKEKAFGILFGNAQRLIHPEIRNLDFTQKCKIGAEREKIALIKTMDLFNVSRYLKENKDEGFRKQCRKAIYNGLGRLVEFPTTPTNDDN